MENTLRILHTADLHLGCEFAFLPPSERAKRKAELLICCENILGKNYDMGEIFLVLLQNNIHGMIYEKYSLLPTPVEWSGKILFLETSELKITPDKLEDVLMEFKNRNIFNLVKGVIIGKTKTKTICLNFQTVLGGKS